MAHVHVFAWEQKLPGTPVNRFPLAHGETDRFDPVHVEGGFLIGATVDRNRITAVRVVCRRDEPLLLFHGLGECWTLNGVPREGDFLRKTATPGQ